MSRAHLLVAVAVVATALAVTSTALAGPQVQVVLSPNPASPGDLITVSFTGGFTNQCAQFGGGFVSNVTLTPVGGGSAIGPIAFNGNPGTFTLPASAPLGEYSASVNCAFASDSGINRTTTLTVVAGPPLTTTPPGTEQTGATVAVVAAPTFTG